MSFKSLTLDGMIKHGAVVDAAFVPAIRPDVAKDIAEKHAAAEVQRFAQYLKDQGFCPDLAYSNHVMDCYATFNTSES